MNDLKQEFLSMPEVQRLKELEGFIDKNADLNKKIEDLKSLQKQMVNAKEYHLEKQYAEYKKQYDSLYETILDFPFVEEYLELLEEVNVTMQSITSIIEYKINQNIKE